MAARWRSSKIDFRLRLAVAGQSGVGGSLYGGVQALVIGRGLKGLLGGTAGGNLLFQIGG